MMTIVNNNWKLIIGIILVIIVVSTYLFSDGTLHTARDIPSFLDQQNKELFARNSKLDTKIQDLKIQAESLQEVIDQKDQQIYHLKTVLDEKINHINNYSIDELKQFFTKFRTDSISH